ncbi:MAG: hypothetical protein DRH56_04105 [Deltaproteobacteria bacterium]|nr:MAG: hypothetical protein DRH56_04105 [Deltaproteobacteria bacterium]
MKDHYSHRPWAEKPEPLVSSFQNPVLLRAATGISFLFSRRSIRDGRAFLPLRTSRQVVSENHGTFSGRDSGMFPPPPFMPGQGEPGDFPEKIPAQWPRQSLLNGHHARAGGDGYCF